MTKAEAGRIGGLATVNKHGRAHMAAIGRKGAAVLHDRYRLAPVGTSDFALVHRETGRIIAMLSGAAIYGRRNDTIDF